MGQFQVKESSNRVPPEDSYWLDLVWIELCEGNLGDYYRWHWVVADVEGQKEWAGCRGTGQTSLTPTLNNRFGAFLEVLNGGLQVDEVGSTEDLIMAKYRVKGFVEHNKKTYKNEEVTFANVSKLIEGSSKKGQGIGYQGVSERLKPEVNKFLAEKGLPLLKISEQAQSGSGQASGQAKPKKETVSKKSDIPW